MNLLSVSQETAISMLDSFDVNGVDTDNLVYISIKKKKSKIKSFSIYFQIGDRVIRISDHWSNSDYNPNIHQKLKCGLIGRSRQNWDVSGMKLFKYKGMCLIAASMDASEYFDIKH